MRIFNGPVTPAVAVGLAAVAASAAATGVSTYQASEAAKAREKDAEAAARAEALAAERDKRDEQVTEAARQARLRAVAAAGGNENVLSLSGRSLLESTTRTGRISNDAFTKMSGLGTLGNNIARQRVLGLGSSAAGGLAQGLSGTANTGVFNG